MSKKIVVAISVITLLTGVGFIMSQEGMRGSGGRGGPQGGRPPFGPMGGPMGKWFENLTKAYEQKDLNKIGQQRPQQLLARSRQGAQQRPGGSEERPQGRRRRAPGRSADRVRQLGVIKNTDKVKGHIVPKSSYIDNYN